MKKLVIILIVTITVLAGTTVYGLISCQKYKKQIIQLNVQISSKDAKLSSLEKEIDNLKMMNRDLEHKTSEEYLIDVRLQDCIRRNYSTAGMANCVYISMDDWNKEIDKNIAKLKKIMTKEQITLLESSQKEWKEYVEAQWKLNNETLGTMVGTLYSVTIRSGDNVELVKDRAKKLNALYDIYSEKR